MIRYLHKIISVLLVLCCSFTLSQAQLTVIDNVTATQLVNKLVGQGVVTMNPTLTCRSTGSGTFSGTSNLGIDSGIVLTTGSAKTNTATFTVGVDAIATQGMSYTGGNTPGDGDLTSIINGSATNNACVLEFDFIPSGDTVRFQYVFGSEEYPEYACSSFNDVFAFLISGPGIVSNIPAIPTKRNIALVPGTNVPIAINTVNPGAGINGNIATCNAIAPGSPFTAYYVDNLIPTANPNIVFDGMTTVLTAIQDVIPCQTYHLKLAIADAVDGALNSGVFLKAGSLMSTPVQTENITGGGGGSNKLHTVRGCNPAVIRYKRLGCDTLQPFTFHLQVSGTAVNGTDYAFIAPTLVVPGGSSTVDLHIQGLLPPLGSNKYVIIGVLHPDSVVAGASIIPVLKRDTVYILDSLFVNILTPEQAVCPNTTISITAETDPSLSFSWTPVQYNTGSLTITPTLLTTRDFTITVTQPGAPATCPPRRKTYHALVEQYPIISAPSDTIVCGQDSAVIPVSVYPDSVNYLYNWSPGTGLRATNIGTNFLFRPAGTYPYTITVTTPQAHCVSTHNININVRPPFDLSYVRPQSGTVVEYGKEVDMSAQGAVLYSWFPPGQFYNPDMPVARTLPVLEPATYSVLGIDEYGCKDTAKIFLDVKYPLDPIMPNAFTPNGDGKNDVFGLTNAKFQKLLRFEVYNRWGQQVFTTIDPLKGWDGTVEGKDCAQAVYTYIIVVELPDKNIKTYKGDVTLFR
ncbi:hypothetical protein D3C71_446690 [compost metagenome]